MPRLVVLVCLSGCIGCVGNQTLTRRTTTPASLGPLVVANKPAAIRMVLPPSRMQPDQSQLSVNNLGEAHLPTARSMVGEGQPATARLDAAQPKQEGVVTAQHSVNSLQNVDLPDPITSTTPIPHPIDDTLFVEEEPGSTQPANKVDLNLPSALAMVGGRHPAVGFAQWRVQEAYAQLARAKVLWLPSLRAGFGFNRHDGNLQASDGSINDVNRNSFQYGLGVGAVGAGTTPLPGLVARFHLADALFQPKIARKTAWARGHAARAVVNQQLLSVASSYLELLGAYQDARIVQESRYRTADLAKITGDFAATGEGLQADADRLETELALVDDRLMGARERIALASASLAQAVSLDAGCDIMPLDLVAVPLELITTNTDKCSLISTGLTTRPELKESQALVAAACDAYRREKVAPFVPSTLLGFSAGGFGGGLGNNINNVNGRYDFDALMSWEVRNFGFGERASRREFASRVQQAKFAKIRVMDQVAREVSEAYSQVQLRRQRLSITERAILSAQDSYTRNLSRIRDGQGLPLEVLQSLQALEEARRAYLRAVIDFNQAQFRLQWALGWPVTAPSEPNVEVTADVNLADSTPKWPDGDSAVSHEDAWVGTE